MNRKFIYFTLMFLANMVLLYFFIGSAGTAVIVAVSVGNALFVVLGEKYAMRLVIKLTKRILREKSE